MPTGYTAKLYEGEEQSARDFILSCARAFGATIHQRDEDSDAPPRPRGPFVSYHDEHLLAARQTLEQAPGWTDEKVDRLAWEEHEAAVVAWQESEAKKTERRRRYESMLKEVGRWSPPTPDHQGLKDFMLTQLRESIDFDCKPYDPPVAELGAEYRARIIARAHRDVEYHEREHQEEVERTERANLWISALYDSLSVGVPA